MDWVPGAFSEGYRTALAEFDGTDLYEHADPRQGEHQDWGTLIFNFGRNEVRNFLIAQRALLARPISHRRPARGCGRLDALSRLLAQGGRMDPERIRRAREPRSRLFPETLQRSLLRAFPGHHDHRRGINRLAAASRARRIWADSASAFKWNMGWMHDFLRYMAARSDLPPVPSRTASRSRCIYAFQEHFVLVLSHDEVVHGKRLAARQNAGRCMAEVRAICGCFMRGCLDIRGKSFSLWAASSGNGANGIMTRHWIGDYCNRRCTDGLRRLVQHLNYLLPRASRRLWDLDDAYEGF